MNQVDVTLVVVPRERFSYSRESLESIYQCTDHPFSLVYIDGNSPEKIKQYLEQKAVENQFKLIRTEQYLSPNQARNIGLKHVKTKYLVFLDNDIHVSPGWLKKLIKCAEERDADVVAPLVCIGQKLHSKIHLAGGEARIVLEVKNNKMKRKVHEKHYFVNRLVAEVKDQLQQRRCEFAEFHGVLVRTDIFNQIGVLDEKLLSTREHIDFSMSVTAAGGKIYCEPDSVVTYVPDSGFEWSDLTYFMLRWSDAWEVASLEHFSQKWDLPQQDKYFKKRYKRLGQRRHQAFLRPVVRQVSIGGYYTWLEKLLISAERKLNHHITDRALCVASINSAASTQFNRLGKEELIINN
ncbi:glycosyltransferase family 2 protein [Pleurocapsa sp. PCC 7319]|uniref:glycosyltransferase family 2 protein n=1 Tax=Pleurocapsa sp. PCC 7319 TaxID=118161 RepID=UPI0003473E69|nr:glycosyltransferase [Pleurocapsa sp. PCC 7319]